MQAFERWCSRCGKIENIRRLKYNESQRQKLSPKDHSELLYISETPKQDIQQMMRATVTAAYQEETVSESEGPLVARTDICRCSQMRKCIKRLHLSHKLNTTHIKLCMDTHKREQTYSRGSCVQKKGKRSGTKKSREPKLVIHRAYSNWLHSPVSYTHLTLPKSDLV